MRRRGVGRREDGFEVRRRDKPLDEGFRFVEHLNDLNLF